MNATIKYVLRKLKASKTFSLINILGLGISLTVSVVVFLYVDYETSFDKYNKDAKEIYLAIEDQDFGSVFPVPFSGALKNDIPAIEEAASILPWEIPKKLKTTKGEFAETCIYLEETVFSLFNIDILFQNSSEIFPDLNSLAISESLATKLYGSANLAIGKPVTVEKDKVEIISTVFRDIPPNSSVRFEVAAPLQTAIKLFNIDVSWNSSYVRTFVKLDHPLEQVSPVLSRFMEEHELEFSLFPITNLHLAQNEGSQKATIKIAVLASFFVLLLACINFINLSTANILKRTKEVGLNKILGSTRRSIFTNFVVETIEFSSVSIVLAFVIAILLLPYINNLIGTSLSLKQFDIPKLGLLFAIVSGTSVITALIPFWFYVKTKPIHLFNKELNRKQSTVFLRKGLLVTQLSLTIIIVIATLFISKQVEYIGNTNLGFEKDKMIFLESSELRDFTQKAELFKEELQQSPFITSISTVDCKPGLIGSSTTGFNWSGKNVDSNTSCYLYRVGDGFVNTFGLKLLDGEEFSSNQSNKGKILINETFARLIAENETTANKTIFYGKRPLQVIGIVNDFTFNSIKERQQPSAIFYDPSRGFYPCIRYADSQNIPAVLAQINKTMSQVYPDLDYNITFADDFILNEFMASEIRLSRFFSLFSVLGLVICCIGLLGLTLFESQKRTKEIGIRKVNGAKISEVLVMLNKDFVKWVAIAFVIATPLSYFAMQRWLENFAYKTELSWWIFALAGLLALGIALLTVSWQSWRAATRNPVEALRYE